MNGIFVGNVFTNSYDVSNKSNDIILISKLSKKEIENYISEFIRPDQKYLTVFTKIDKLNQKERSKLKKEFPGSITLSNLKKNGHDRVHQIILQTIFGVDDESKSENGEEG